MPLEAGHIKHFSMNDTGSTMSPDKGSGSGTIISMLNKNVQLHPSSTMRSHEGDGIGSKIQMTAANALIDTSMGTTWGLSVYIVPTWTSLSSSLKSIISQGSANVDLLLRSFSQASGAPDFDDQVIVQADPALTSNFAKSLGPLNAEIRPTLLSVDVTPTTARFWSNGLFQGSAPAGSSTKETLYLFASNVGTSQFADAKIGPINVWNRAFDDTAEVASQYDGLKDFDLGSGLFKSTMAQTGLTTSLKILLGLV